MSINQLQVPDGPVDAVIQNRLTVAGTVLAALFFAGSFANSLNAQLESVHKRDFRITFIYLETEMVIGALLIIASMLCFLNCQQMPSGTQRWYVSKRFWFITANNSLHLSIGQAMSAALTELVFGIGLKALVLAKWLAVFGTLLWVGLIFIAPLYALYSWWPTLHRGEKIATVITYTMILMFLLSMNALAFVYENQLPNTFASFFDEFLRQIFKPMTWPQSWDWDLDT